MTPKISELPIEELVERFLQSQLRHQAAVRVQNVPVANRHSEVTMRAAEALMNSAPGRNALERLLTHSEPFVRLRAAQYVRRWAPDIAIPVLGRMLIDDSGADLSVDEQLELTIDAKDSLYAQFGIRSFDWNDLIEPLKEYDIDLPVRNRRQRY